MEKHTQADFLEFMKEVRGILKNAFGDAVSRETLELAAGYHARGTTPGYCAYALARHAGLCKPF